VCAWSQVGLSGYTFWHRSDIALHEFSAARRPFWGESSLDLQHHHSPKRGWQELFIT
jgi:hypothetical protein